MMFSLAAALLMTHELDAVRHQEWLVLPVLRSLETDTGYVWFVLGHIPLFALIFYVLARGPETARVRVASVFCGFCIVHAGLHFLFSGHEAYDFDGMLSSSLIAGAALFGLLYFVATYFDQANNT